MLDDLLGDPFLQNFFGATVPKDITVSSSPSELTVLELPTEGRPPDFNGAVGSFKIDGTLSSASAAAGDPLTLRMHVTGAGNFDRVDSPMLERLDQWKTYPPKSTFKPSDAVGYKGEKTFEQPLIASKPGAQTLPGLAFSYFDPTTRRYETARSAPLTVTISPSAADSASNMAQAPVTAASPAAPRNDGLRADHAVAEAGVSSLVPLYLQPRFLAIPSLLALVFGGGWLGLRRQPGATPTRWMRERRRSRVTGAVKEMEVAVKAGNAALFFNLARTELLRILAAPGKLRPDQMTSAEIAARLGGESEEIRRIFALADEANYSGHVPAADLERWLPIVRGRLTEAQG
jgi:hypothetical protein